MKQHPAEHGIEFGLDTQPLLALLRIDGTKLESATGEQLIDHLWEQFEHEVDHQLHTLNWTGDPADAPINIDIATQRATATTTLWWHSDHAPNGHLIDDDNGTVRPATRHERDAYYAGHLDDPYHID